ncbi:MAG: anthranilate synthase component II [Candidatus Limnocylindria bacterium]
MTRVLLVDNYDSFTWNLAQALGSLGADVEVLRADDPALSGALASGTDRVVISPGPGRPEAAGSSPRLVREAPAAGIPTLGVCLGLQCAAVAFGAAVVRAPEPRHGKTSLIRHDGRGVFRGIPDPTVATRYHSLMVDERTLPPELEVSARSDDGVVMGLRHRELPLEAVQFHPESVLSADGPALLRNFLERRGAPRRPSPRAGD